MLPFYDPNPISSYHCWELCASRLECSLQSHPPISSSPGQYFHTCKERPISLHCTNSQAQRLLLSFVMTGLYDFSLAWWRACVCIHNYMPTVDCLSSMKNKTACIVTQTMLTWIITMTTRLDPPVWSQAKSLSVIGRKMANTDKFWLRMKKNKAHGIWWVLDQTMQVSVRKLWNKAMPLRGQRGDVLMMTFAVQTYNLQIKVVFLKGSPCFYYRSNSLHIFQNLRLLFKSLWTGKHSWPCIFSSLHDQWSLTSEGATSNSNKIIIRLSRLIVRSSIPLSNPTQVSAWGVSSS